MVVLDYSRRRLRALLTEIQALRSSGFPYAQLDEVLEVIERSFEEYLDSIEQLTAENDPATVKNACATGLDAIFVYLPLLGFIVRSTHVRNPFEAYGPLLRLFKEVLHKDAKLIISSEWEHSPLTFTEFAKLPGVVFIGLPAQESQNPLLLSLAGHELGHTIWPVQNRFISEIHRRIEDHLIAELGNTHWTKLQQLRPELKRPDDLKELQGRAIWKPARAWAASQCEEVFCDCLAVRLFGISYLHAFAYLLSPGSTIQRSYSYPKLQKRTANLCRAADAYKVGTPNGFRSLFVEQEDTKGSEENRLLVETADSAEELVFESIRDHVEQLTASMDLTDRPVTTILEDFRSCVPARGAKSIADILNAGWLVHSEGESYWPTLNVEARFDLLRELMLKSMEVMEYEYIIKDARP